MTATLGDCIKNVIAELTL